MERLSSADFGKVIFGLGDVLVQVPTGLLCSCLCSCLCIAQLLVQLLVQMVVQQLAVQPAA